MNRVQANRRVDAFRKQVRNFNRARGRVALGAHVNHPHARGERAINNRAPILVERRKVRVRVRVKETRRI